MSREESNMGKLVSGCITGEERTTTMQKITEIGTVVPFD